MIMNKFAKSSNTNQQIKWVGFVIITCINSKSETNQHKFNDFKNSIKTFLQTKFDPQSNETFSIYKKNFIFMEADENYVIIPDNDIDGLTFNSKTNRNVSEITEEHIKLLLK